MVEGRGLTLTRFFKIFPKSCNVYKAIFHSLGNNVILTKKIII